MSEKIMKKSRTLIAALLGTVMIAALTIWGCGTSSYDNPQDSAVTTKTATALITAADLKTWVDAGLVNKTGGSDRVVILDVTADSTNDNGTPTVTTDDFKYNKYNTVGHIPGAQLILGAGVFQAVRAEGPLNENGAVVCTGATMDTLIQNAGIDKYTTIVVTSSGSIVDLARTYTTFRYWGFPKNRIKVLNGGNAGWTAAGYALTTKASTVVKSTYGVSQNQSNVNTDMRTSLVEMIAYVKDIVAGNTNKVTLIDTVRGSATVVNATVSGPTGDLITTGVTPFDGAIKGSYSYFAPRMVTSGLYFKDPAAIRADLIAAYGTDGVTQLGEANLDATKTFVSFCRAGNYASVGYFALDGIAYYNSNVDVKWYDGSLGQFNMLASSDHVAVNGTNAGGKLAVGSIWDTTSLLDNLTWNVDRAQTIVSYGHRVFAVEPSFADGNQLEDADRAYRSAVSSTSGGAVAGGGGGC